MANFSYEQISLTVAGWSVFAAIWLHAVGFALKFKDAAKNKIYQNICSATMIIAFVALTVALAVRGFGLGHVPIRNLYESMIILCWGLLGSYIFLEFKYQFRQFGAFVAIIVMGIFLNASWLPLSQKEWTPLIPALQSYWRAIHVPPLLVSYALFLLAALAAIAYLITHQINKSKLKDKAVVDKLDFYEEATYRCIVFAFPLLTFGIICGALWANHAWGALWQWDPKETLALVTWFFYAAYIHLRLRGVSAVKTSALAVFGLIAVYVTYVGINQFQLGGLHSYGNVE